MHFSVSMSAIFYYNVIQGSATLRLSLDREGEWPGSCEVDLCFFSISMSAPSLHGAVHNVIIASSTHIHPAVQRS